ncbi:DUF4097 family beta strand repeat-containing protein [Paenibacillus woosongensis]|uniref:DUF4097 family beta strand repeat-containing protein n=1 Tax=Paenibacillus woosongensis TaxID=307580 RepID=A0AA95I4A1_9BACL|nr:DUF4097 family beta strand repeat-containing protein [Paenibacillus woosongensis]WHX49560.1 DUF4097 family beta strand repeat-containing protein [Paenibacillus woosongensis]
MTKNMRNILRLAIVLIAVAVIGNVVMYVMGNSPFNVENFDIQRSASTEQVKELYIRAETGTVKIIPIEGNEIEAILEGRTTKKWLKDYHLVMDKERGRVQIEIVQDSRMRFFDLYTKLQLTVGIPAAELDQLQVVTDTASIYIESVHANEYELASDTGNIEVNAAEGLLNVKSDTGAIEIALERINYDIKAVTDTGDITIQTAKAPEALRTKLETDSGQIHVTLPHYEDDHIGDGGPLLHLVSDTGNLIIEHK